jgi:hypothetical protein
VAIQEISARIGRGTGFGIAGNLRRHYPVLAIRGTKLVLNVYRSWIGERATGDLRRRVHALISSHSPASSTPG